MTTEASKVLEALMLEWTKAEESLSVATNALEMYRKMERERSPEDSYKVGTQLHYKRSVGSFVSLNIPLDGELFYATINMVIATHQRRMSMLKSLINNLGMEFTHVKD